MDFILNMMDSILKMMGFRFVFSLLLCSRGLIDHVVWKLYIRSAEGGKDMSTSFLARVCCSHCKFLPRRLRPRPAYPGDFDARLLVRH